MLEVMKVLISSGGIVDYRSMCSQFGKAIINSMIKYNIMRIRPTATITFDLPWHIITHELPAAEVAMTQHNEIGYCL